MHRLPAPSALPLEEHAGTARQGEGPKVALQSPQDAFLSNRTYSKDNHIHLLVDESMITIDLATTVSGVLTGERPVSSSFLLPLHVAGR